MQSGTDPSGWMDMRKVETFVFQANGPRAHKADILRFSPVERMVIIVRQVCRVITDVGSDFVTQLRNLRPIKPEQCAFGLRALP